jgi:protein-S-isoprenylcysteine O-methyltransferase Ste14
MLLLFSLLADAYERQTRVRASSSACSFGALLFVFLSACLFAAPLNLRAPSTPPTRKQTNQTGTKPGRGHQTSTRIQRRFLCAAQSKAAARIALTCTSHSCCSWCVVWLCWRVVFCAAFAVSLAARTNKTSTPHRSTLPKKQHSILDSTHGHMATSTAAATGEQQQP